MESKNKEAIFNEKVAPLVTMIEALCIEHSIPYVVVFQLGLTEDTEHINSAYMVQDDDSDRLLEVCHILEQKVEPVLDNPDQIVVN